MTTGKEQLWHRSKDAYLTVSIDRVLFQEHIPVEHEFPLTGTDIRSITDISLHLILHIMDRLRLLLLWEKLLPNGGIYQSQALVLR